MPGVNSIYLAYVVLAIVAFAALSTRRALLATYMTGWLVLPVGPYPDGFDHFTIELIGTALPAPAMLVDKAWVTPVVTLLLAAVFDRCTLLTWRPRWIDLPMALWCLWPLVGFAATAPSPAPVVSCIYLVGVWASPWLLGRIYLCGPDDRSALAGALANGALILVPAALAENVTGPFFYTAMYGTHPLATDGATRYVGYRPLLFFEDGNQYGIAIALSALAALAIWRADPGRMRLVRALVLSVVAFLSQSVGAIALLLVGAAFLIARPSIQSVRRVALVVTAFGAVVGPLYLSGVLPIDAVVRDTAPGRAVLAAVRATGRGSLPWRVAQDQKVMPLLRHNPFLGTSRWDWWRASGTRPWGLVLLIVGQFGLLGLATIAACVLSTGWRGLTADRAGTTVTTGLALIVLLTTTDAFLNAFIFLPALVTAGAIAADATELRRRARPAGGNRVVDYLASPLDERPSSEHA